MSLSAFRRSFRLAGLCLILLFISIGCRSHESCYKTYSFEGTVTNSNGAPAMGIDVMFTRPLKTKQGTTDSQGRYSFSWSTQGDATGATIGFNSGEAEIGVSDPLTAGEAAPDSCGSRSIVRNVQLAK